MLVSNCDQRKAQSQREASEVLQAEDGKATRIEVSRRAEPQSRSQPRAAAGAAFAGEPYSRINTKVASRIAR